MTILSRQAHAAAVIALCTQTLHAGVNYLAQDRTVSVSASWADSRGGGGSESNADAALDMAPYHGEVAAMTQNSTSNATQSSTLNAANVIGAGSATGSATGDGGFTGGCVSDSNMSVTFEVAEPIDYALSGTVAAGTTAFFLAVETGVALVHKSSGTIFQFTPAYCEFGCTLPLDHTGTLQPGTYTLTAQAHVNGALCCGVPIDEGNASYDFLLTLGTPCPGDANGDTVIDVDDLIATILDWGTDGSGHGGDANGSGLVDISDIMQVVLSWGPC